MTSVDGTTSVLLESLPHRTVLMDGPLHAVVRYAAAPDGSGCHSRAIIGKFYRDGEGPRAARIMEAVYAGVHASAAAAVLRVPRPLGFDADRQLVLQEAIPGVRFDALLSSPDVVRSLDLAGRALAAFHALDIPLPGRPRQMGDHIDELIRPHPSRLADALPALAPRIGRILGRLFDLDRWWRPRRRDVAIHRDVHPKQLFLEGERVGLIDWDLSARGDAALDLGNLVAYLRARRMMTDPAIDALVRGYGSSSTPDVLERAPVYEALTYVRLSCKRFRLGEPGWRDACAHLLARAERCLEIGELTMSKVKVAHVIKGMGLGGVTRSCSS